MLRRNSLVNILTFKIYPTNNFDIRDFQPHIFREAAEVSTPDTIRSNRWEWKKKKQLWHTTFCVLTWWFVFFARNSSQCVFNSLAFVRYHTCHLLIYPTDNLLHSISPQTTWWHRECIFWHEISLQRKVRFQKANLNKKVYQLNLTWH